MKTFAEVFALFPQEVQERYDFSKAVYTGALKPISGIVCRKHGVFGQYAAQLRKGGAGCPACGNTLRADKRRMSQEDFVAECAKRHNDRYSYEDTVYQRMSGKITVTCPNHGPFNITALKHYYETQGCSACEAENKKYRIKDYRHLSPASKIANTGLTFFERCSERHGGIYTYPEQEYGGAKTLIRAVCPAHGEFQQSAWKHLNGHGCSRCVTRSRGEDAIAEFLAEHTTVERRDRKILCPKEIDIWLPDLNTGIEYHGLYWHTADRNGFGHLDKWQLATDKGIRLIQIFEDEWLDNPDIVRSRLLALVGLSKRTFARNTIVSRIETSAAREFLNLHHTQGGSASVAAYGLHLGEELVAVATFGRARGGAMSSVSETSWEVYRYASEGVVVGGFSKLFSAFLKDFSPGVVVSYCDLRYGDGKLYEATGFKLEHISPPDYWWVPSGKAERIPRYRTQKHKLPTHPILKDYYKVGMTERETCEAAGWKKIYGVGNQKWIWRRA